MTARKSKGMRGESFSTSVVISRADSFVLPGASYASVWQTVMGFNPTWRNRAADKTQAIGRKEFDPYRRRQAPGDGVGIHPDGWRQEENRCRELPAHDRRRCLRGSLCHSESRKGSRAAFLVRRVLEPRRPTAGLGEVPFALPGKAEHKHQR